ncbi:hypothetical protein QOZ80_5AG0363140 [Eleusine coracana subsp. coracana]|nr:hypothetical protein QOZ80_5AG0363140 [Eleusine coracana subsp. coracana]
MASSNRHWPSMYRSSLACNIQQPQQPDMNNGAGGKSSLMSSRCDEGRNPEPRPRWNPRPEQIRILEGIFNSGMVNPARDEIRRIRLQLSEHGPVGDANVFYWFQNRKSRTKHKLRASGQLQPSGRAALMRAAPAPVTPPRHLIPAAAPTSSSSSSSDRSSGSSNKSVMKPPLTAAGFLPATAMDFLSPAPAPPFLAARQLYYHSQIVAPPPPTVVPHTTPELMMITSPDPLLLQQWHQQSQSSYMPANELGAQYAHAPPATHAPVVSPNVLLGLCNQALGQEDCVNINCSNKGLVGHGQQYWNNCSSDELSTKTDDAVSAVIRDDEKARLGSPLHYDFGVTTAAAATSAPLSVPVHAAGDADSTATMLPVPSAAAASPVNNVAAAAPSAVLTDQLQGLLDFGLISRTAPPTATLVAVTRDAVTCTSSMQFSVPAMRLDVKQFGEAAVLLRHPGEPVVVDESGVTVEPLQQDAIYYVLVTGDLLNMMYNNE